MADLEYPWNIIGPFFIPSTVDQNRAYPLNPGAKSRRAAASPLVRRLIDQPPLAKARAMLADPDAYYAQVRAERDAGAGGTQ